MSTDSSPHEKLPARLLFFNGLVGIEKFATKRSLLRDLSMLPVREWFFVLEQLVFSFISFLDIKRLKICLSLAMLLIAKCLLFALLDRLSL